DWTTLGRFGTTWEALDVLRGAHIRRTRLVAAPEVEAVGLSRRGLPRQAVNNVRDDERARRFLTSEVPPVTSGKNKGRILRPARNEWLDTSKLDAEDLCFHRGELSVRQGTGLVQLAELFELGERVICGGCGRGGRGGLRGPGRVAHRVCHCLAEGDTRTET